MSKYTGIVCNRSKSEKRDYMTRQECDACVLRPDHPCSFHGKMLARMWGDGDKEPGADAFSPTRLQGCMRKKWFVSHGEDYHQLLDPTTAYNMMRGHFVHEFFEHLPYAPGTQLEVAEVRFQHVIQTKYGPKLFQGKPDLIEIKEDKDDVLTVKVVDWKSTKDIPHDFLEPKVDHMRQVNMYAWLVMKELPLYLNRKCVVIVDELEICYLDMKKVRRFTSKCTLIDRGKLLAPRNQKNYDSIKLERVIRFSMDSMESRIRAAIEQAIEAQEVLYAPLEGDAARICDYCSFQKECQRLWTEENR